VATKTNVKLINTIKISSTIAKDRIQTIILVVTLRNVNTCLPSRFGSLVAIVWRLLEVGAKA
jgi:hypothetical protein